MTRFAGWLIAALLIALVGGLRWQVDNRAERLLAGEVRAQETVNTLVLASDAAFGHAGPHPGLPAILSDVPWLVRLSEHDDGDVSFAHDDVYLYGLALTVEVDGDGVHHGWVLRAWPRQFGITGDLEFHVSESGPLWQGYNDRGRSGTTTGFPPAFPEPGLGQPNRIWRPRERPHK